MHFLLIAAMVELVDTLVLGTSEAVSKVAKQFNKLDSNSHFIFLSGDNIGTLYVKNGVKNGNNRETKIRLESENKT